MIRGGSARKSILVDGKRRNQCFRGAGDRSFTTASRTGDGEQDSSSPRQINSDESLNVALRGCSSALREEGGREGEEPRLLYLLQWTYDEEEEKEEEGNIINACVSLVRVKRGEGCECP